MLSGRATLSLAGEIRTRMDIRADMADAHRRSWAQLAEPGVWLTGAERIGIAAEARHARGCALCAARRDALSPMAVAGAHDTLIAVMPAEIEAVHRIVSDSGRLAETWYRGLLAAGLSETRYVELVAVVAVVSAIDTFRYAAGLDEWALPEPLPGAPSRRRPRNARVDMAWVPTLAPAERTDDDPDLYGDHPGPRARPGANIQRALSLVPAAMMQWWDTFEPMYFTSAQMRDYANEPRAVTHPQMEMLAARVAALNRCEY
jgi:hypothetical protein